MAKKTRKEIEETIRNKMANKHNEYAEIQQKNIVYYGTDTKRLAVSVINIGRRTKN